MENKTAYQPKTLFRCRQWHIFSTGKSCSLCGNRCSPYTDFASLSPPSIVRPPVPCFDCFFFAGQPRYCHLLCVEAITGPISPTTGSPPKICSIVGIVHMDDGCNSTALRARFQFKHPSSPPMLSFGAHIYLNLRVQKEHVLAAIQPSAYHITYTGLYLKSQPTHATSFRYLLL